jgi:nitrogen fixation protein FixH
MRYVALVAAALLWSGSAMAQHKHDAMKGPNGGPMQDAAGVHVELIVAGNSVTINLFDESNKPVSSKGFSGSALIVSGADRETVTLAPAGDSALKGEARKAIAAGASTTVVVKNAAGKSGQARF